MRSRRSLTQVSRTPRLSTKGHERTLRLSDQNSRKLPVGDVGDCDVYTHVAPGVVSTTSLRDVCPRVRDRRANLKSESNKGESDNSTS